MVEAQMTRDRLRTNWFKVSLLVVCVIALVAIIYGQEQERHHRYSLRPIQTSEILSCIPPGYQLAQTEHGKNDINYIKAYLQKLPDYEVVLLLEWSEPQTGMSPKHPALAKILKFNHESDKWQEIAQISFGDHANVRFSYHKIRIEGDPTEKIVVFPYTISIHDMTVDDRGNILAVNENPTMWQSVAVLDFKGGELHEKMGYGFGAPLIDNITADGGDDSLVVYNGALIFGSYVKEPGASWQGCYPIKYERYVYKKRGGVFGVGGFEKYDECVTTMKFTQSFSFKDKCTWIICAASPFLEKSGVPKNFMEPPKGKDILKVKSGS